MLRKLKNSGLQQSLRFKHSSAALEQIRERLENGPNFQDFIQNPKHSRDELAKEFDGKLKKEKGEKDRLRLPPWLKTTIPVGEFVFEIVQKNGKFNELRHFKVKITTKLKINCEN